MDSKAIWITAPDGCGVKCPEFYLKFNTEKPIKKAELLLSAIGMYTAYINGERVGNELFTPYCTDTRYRVQYQRYEVTEMLARENELRILCAEGWAAGKVPSYHPCRTEMPEHISVIYWLEIEYADGSRGCIYSDENTRVRSSQLMSSEIFNGEELDKTAQVTEYGRAVCDAVKTELVPMEGEAVTEHERIAPVRCFITPAGERVIDFGQNIAGYVEIKLSAERGSRISISHAEILDQSGNFYTENLRSAKQRMTYVLSRSGTEILKPQFSWQGFRYIRLDEYPLEKIDLSAFRAVAVYSDIKRTGHFMCGSAGINQLYHNIIWGQKSNFIDIPTDCPQRDERQGWLGDAQVFIRTAAINYDVEKFFGKWLKDVALGQRSDGAVIGIAPIISTSFKTLASAGWGDAAVICPWELYLAYGNKAVLEAQFESMKGWIDYMRGAGSEEFLWLGGEHYGDWLAMDGDELKGGTSHDYIASAFYAYSTSLFIKAGKILGKDMGEYEELYKNIAARFGAVFTRGGVPVENTQTAYVLALHFGLCGDRTETAKRLVRLIEENGMRLTTGFLGTPYLLHALTDAGRADIAYNLLFQENAPSWLFSVNKGATTMWEHWDGIKSDGSLWDSKMNSFNHYAYGAVFDWIFGCAAGIKVLDDGAGYSHISVKPHFDKRMGFLNASLETRLGKLEILWYYKKNEVCVELSIPSGASAELELPGGYTETISGGTYKYTVFLGEEEQ